MRLTGKRLKLFLALMVVLTALTLLVTPFIGINSISLESVLNPGSGGTGANIFWNIRVPRVLLSFLCGASLGLSGMVFQAMFRNPLATPFTLGVAGGASLGAAVFVRLGVAFFIFSISGIALFAFAGALLAIMLVYGISRIRSGFSTATMLLAGVALNFFFSSLIMFLQYMSDFTHSFRILRWLMGHFDAVSYDSVLNMLPFVVVGVLIIFYYIREINLLSVGDALAASRGMNLKQTRTILFFATSLMVGAVVAECGPIGFVGMMSPHIMRLIIGPDHRRLGWTTMLFGGLFLTLCDTVSRVVIAPAELPVGVITSLLGGPFFIWLLVSDNSENSLM